MVFLHADFDAPAVVDADHGTVLSHRGLAEAADAFAAASGYDAGALVFLFADASEQGIIAFNAALRSGAPVALLDPATHPDLAAGLVDRYRPAVVVDPSARIGPLLDSYRPSSSCAWHRDGGVEPAHPELAVLLTTSGSTGSPKFVRLSRGNVAANATAIVASLGITGRDRAIATLPLHYSFGMSVVNTHLAAGGSVVCTTSTMMDSAFWKVVREHEPTSISGVPYTFQMLRRLDLETLDVPSVRMLTQAGGTLDSSLVRHFHELMSRRSGAFHVMYGQTEAAPRMTCLPHGDLPEKIGSAGRPLQGGTIDICDDRGRPLPPGSTGEVVYSGPNVMMGYAESAADLALGDVHGDRLRTGDVGRLDADGVLYISGRTRRIGKIYGVRVNLDEVEQMLRADGPVAAVADADRIVVYCERISDADVDDERRRLAHRLRLPSSSVRFSKVDALPTLANGKTDYRSLELRGRRSATHA